MFPLIYRQPLNTYKNINLVNWNPMTWALAELPFAQNSTSTSKHNTTTQQIIHLAHDTIKNATPKVSRTRHSIPPLLPPAMTVQNTLSDWNLRFSLISI